MFPIQLWSKWINKGSASIPYFLIENYKKIGVTDEEMMLLIHLYSFVKEGIQFPSIEELHERMSCPLEDVSRILNRLHKDKLIDIQSSKNHEGIVEEQYSLEPLWEKMIAFLTEESIASFSAQEEIAVASEKRAAWPSDIKENNQSALEGEIYRRFEQEFGRPLSPIECETIGFWLDEDHYEPHLIFLALREAVISNKLSLRYIDRILFEWQKNGVKTVEEVREHSKKFRQQQSMKTKPESSNQPVEFTFYNWLEK